jgi:NAD kinase
LLLSKPDTDILAALVNCLPFLAQKGLEFYVEESVYDEVKRINLDREKEITGTGAIDENKGVELEGARDNIVLNVFHKDFPRRQGVDLVIAFGGDGLLMHCNTLFGGGSIPPSMCFDFGSLGFLAPFDYKDFEVEVRYAVILAHNIFDLVHLKQN